MKVLVFNGSPKKEKSDTMHITRAFLEGLNETGAHSVRIINAVDKKINYCKGCFTCMKNGGVCVYDDDMKEILSDILSSELLIFSFPLYCYGMPAPLKAIIDRILPLSSMSMKKEGDRYEHECRADYSNLKYVMICGAGFPNGTKNFEPVIEQFKLMFPHNRTIITVPESPMFNAPEAAAVTSLKLAAVKNAGKLYGENGAIAEDVLSDLSSPMIPEEVYAAIVNGDTPKTMEMKLRDEPFYQIKSGEKTVEVRLFDEKRQTLRVGDNITFVRLSNPAEKIFTKVSALFKFPDFIALFSTDLKDKTGFKDLPASKAAEKMGEYYDKEEESKYGVLAIEIVVNE